MNSNIEKLENILNSIPHLLSNKKMYDISNFSDSVFKDDYVSFTSRVMSTNLISFLMENDSFENVIFHPSAPPHGGYAADSISYRYMIHVKFKT
tara:strand:- start:76018 stop:76299 length:282 start_codon:yes stop_codon:yes gene_type:complete